MQLPAFGILMAYVGFLVAAMVFGADPMEPSIEAPREGLGLDPLLQHPAMLIHPPLVLLGYAGWAVPFALAISALAAGGLDAGWIP
ncbi:MAG: c-type cytochrome biogenesis protein CcmF, partial [Gemmatimonadales bacterium]|nr:c-type cytochrome biogenesis protein CcmF [Gemmatimonadales bacterium]